MGGLSRCRLVTGGLVEGGGRLSRAICALCSAVGPLAEMSLNQLGHTCGVVVPGKMTTSWDDL